MNEVKVFAPATVANAAVGYDLMGFAIYGPGDEIIVRRKASSGLAISKITGTGKKRLPLDPERNTAGFAALSLLHHLGLEEIGIEMEIHKKMPFGSGLGSSAASAAAGVFAVNELLDRPLDKASLLPFAVAGEQIADGAYHADNVGPALLGGILFIRNNETLDVHSLPVPDELYVAIVYPHIEVLTKDSRSVLSDTVTLKQHIQQNGNFGGLITGIYESDYNLISRSLDDVIIEPQRARLIPGFPAVKAAALKHGALGCSISGAGPSIFALCRGEVSARTVSLKMQKVLQELGTESDAYSSSINTQGTIRL